MKLLKSRQQNNKNQQMLHFCTIWLEAELGDTGKGRGPLFKIMLAKSLVHCFQTRD